MKQPIFQAIFADQWEDLPACFKAHYANRPRTRDVVVVEGLMNITMNGYMRAFAPLLGLMGMLTPHEGKDVPVTVRFLSEPDSDDFVFERTFRFPNKKPVLFRSKMHMTKPHEVIELMGPNIGWRCGYYYDPIKGNIYHVVMRHRGYVWRLFGKDIPLPQWIEILVGRGHAYEVETGEDSFAMRMEINHSMFKAPIYAYEGRFRVTEVELHD